jgi:hypothetical protein
VHDHPGSLGHYGTAAIRVRRLVVEAEEDEGWYSDPYGLHEARWMSMGNPTKLVRDGETESYEDPPDSPPTQEAIKIEPPPGSETAADTFRADGGDADTMPSITEIDDAERNYVLSGRRGPLLKRDSQHKHDHRFFPDR